MLKSIPTLSPEPTVCTHESASAAKGPAPMLADLKIESRDASPSAPAGALKRAGPRSCPLTMAITISPFAFFDVTIGMTLIGLAVTGSLYGVSTAQAGWYYNHYPRDRTSLKVLVAFVWSFDTLHLVLYAISMWAYVVRKEIQPLGPTSLPWESCAQLLCNACAIVTIQSFYAYRIWTLSQNRYLAALLATFVLGDFGLALTLFLKSVMLNNVEDFVALTSFDIALSTITAFTDVLLCATLCILLALSRTGSAGANRLINKLVLYTINTGLLTSFCAVLSLIAVVVLPTTAIYVMFYYIGTRLYSVSLLSTLNARESLRAQAERIGHVTLPRLTNIPQSASKTSRPPDFVVAIPHSSNVSPEEGQVGIFKEMYRRPHNDREGLLEPDEGARSMREREVGKLASCPALPAE